MMEVLEERSACLSTVFGFGTYDPRLWQLPHTDRLYTGNKRDRGNPRFC